MSGFNRVILMGNLTRDCELRFAPNGMAICDFGLALNRRIKDAAGVWSEEPVYVDVKIFGARGEAFQKFHRKGMPAFIEGALRLDQWQAKDGTGKRTKLYVVADNWEFIGAEKSDNRSRGNPDAVEGGIVGTASGEDAGSTPF